MISKCKWKKRVIVRRDPRIELCYYIGSRSPRDLLKIQGEVHTHCKELMKPEPKFKTDEHAIYI